MDESASEPKSNYPEKTDSPQHLASHELTIKNEAEEPRVNGRPAHEYSESAGLNQRYEENVQSSQLQQYFDGNHEDDHPNLQNTHGTTLSLDEQYHTLKLKKKNSKKVQKILGSQVFELKLFEKEINKLRGLLRRGKVGEFMPMGGGPAIGLGHRPLADHRERNTVSEKLIGGIDFNSQEEEFNGSPTATNLAISQNCILSNHEDHTAGGTTTLILPGGLPSLLNQKSIHMPNRSPNNMGTGYYGLEVLKSHRSNLNRNRSTSNYKIVKLHRQKTVNTNKFESIQGIDKQQSSAYPKFYRSQQQLMNQKQVNSNPTLQVKEETGIVGDNRDEQQIKSTQNMILQDATAEEPIDHNDLNLHFQTKQPNQENTDVQKQANQPPGILQGIQGEWLKGRPINIGQLFNNSSVYFNQLGGVTSRSPKEQRRIGPQNKKGFGGKLGKSHEGLGTAKLGELVPQADSQIQQIVDDQAANQYKSRGSSSITYQKARQSGYTSLTHRNGNKDQQNAAAGGPNRGRLYQKQPYPDRFQQSPTCFSGQGQNQNRNFQNQQSQVLYQVVNMAYDQVLSLSEKLKRHRKKTARLLKKVNKKQDKQNQLIDSLRRKLKIKRNDNDTCQQKKDDATKRTASGQQKAKARKNSISSIESISEGSSCCSGNGGQNRVTREFLHHIHSAHHQAYDNDQLRIRVNQSSKRGLKGNHSPYLPQNNEFSQGASNAENFAQNFYSRNNSGSQLRDIKLEKIEHDSGSNDTPFLTINEESDNCLMIAQQNTLQAAEPQNVQINNWVYEQRNRQENIFFGLGSNQDAQQDIAQMSFNNSSSATFLNNSEQFQQDRAGQTGGGIESCNRLNMGICDINFHPSPEQIAISRKQSAGSQNNFYATADVPGAAVSPDSERVRQELNAFYEDLNRISPVLQLQMAPINPSQSNQEPEAQKSPSQRAKQKNEEEENQQDVPQVMASDLHNLICMQRSRTAAHPKCSRGTVGTTQQTQQLLKNYMNGKNSDMEIMKVEDYENFEEDDKQLFMMTHTFENVLESKQKQHEKMPHAKVKVIQNNKIDREVKIPMLNLNKVVDSRQKEYYICDNPEIVKALQGTRTGLMNNDQNEDELGITVTDDLFANQSGTATSPIDAIVEGLQDIHGSSDAKINVLRQVNDSFKNETSIMRVFYQDQTIRSRTAGAANRSRGNANSKSRSRIVFFKSDSKFSKNKKNHNSQSPISCNISKSPIVHKSLRTKIEKVVMADAQQDAPRVVQVQKFEDADAKSNPQKAHQQSQQTCNIFIRVDAQRAQHKKQSNSQSYQRFHLRRLNELDPQMLFTATGERSQVGKLFPDKCKSAKMPNKVFSFMDSAGMSPNLVALSPNLKQPSKQKKDEVENCAVDQGDNVREFSSYQDENGKLIVKSKQIKVVRNIQENDNTATQAKPAIKLQKIPKIVVPDGKARVLPSRRQNDHDMLTIEAQESNRAVRPSKEGWPLKIITPRAYISKKDEQQPTKVVLKKQTIETDLEFRQYQIEQESRPLQANQPAPNPLHSQKSKIDQLFQDPEQRQKIALYFQKIKKNQELKSNRSEKRSNLPLQEVKRMATGPNSNEGIKQIKLNQINFKPQYQSIRAVPTDGKIAADCEQVGRTDPTLQADVQFDLDAQTIQKMTAKKASNQNSNTTLQNKKQKKTISPFTIQKRLENMKKKKQGQDLETKIFQGYANGPQQMLQAQSQMSLQQNQEVPLVYSQENQTIERPTNTMKEPQTLPHQKTQRLQMKHQRLFGRNEHSGKENNKLRINSVKMSAVESAHQQLSKNQQQSGQLISARFSSQSSKKSCAPPNQSSRSFEQKWQRKPTVSNAGANIQLKMQKNKQFHTSKIDNNAVRSKQQPQGQSIRKLKAESLTRNSRSQSRRNQEPPGAQQRKQTPRNKKSQEQLATKQVKIPEVQKSQVPNQGVRPQIQTQETHEKKTRIQFPLSTKSRYGALQPTPNQVELSTLPAQQTRPKISNKNIIFRSQNPKSNDPQKHRSLERRPQDEPQKNTPQNRIVSNAIKHVEALDPQGQANPAGSNQISELMHKQDKKRNVALLDLSSDLIQLNKQILQKRLIDLPVQNAYSQATKQPQTCQNRNKEPLTFSPSTQEGAPSQSDQLPAGLTRATDGNDQGLDKNYDYPLQRVAHAEQESRNQQSRPKSSNPVKINLRMVNFKQPKSAERSQAQPSSQNASLNQTAKYALVTVKDGAENDYQLGGSKQICNLVLPHGFQVYSECGEGDGDSAGAASLRTYHL